MVACLVKKMKGERGEKHATVMSPRERSGPEHFG